MDLVFQHDQIALVVERFRTELDCLVLVLACIL